MWEIKLSQLKIKDQIHRAFCLSMNIFLFRTLLISLSSFFSSLSLIRRSKTLNVRHSRENLCNFYYLHWQFLQLDFFSLKFLLPFILVLSIFFCVVVVRSSSSKYSRHLSKIPASFFIILPYVAFIHFIGLVFFYARFLCTFPIINFIVTIS